MFVCARDRSFPVSGTVVLEYTNVWSGLCVRETEASRYLVLWYWNIQMCGVVYVCEKQKLPDIWYCGTGIYKCVEWFMCAGDRSFPISGTVVLEYSNVWSGLCVRETEASQYLVLRYWNIKMCGSGLCVRETAASQYP